jgi:hypothetical protein
MKLGAIHPASGATQTKKRRGKGAASGIGGTSGKGHKGHKARAGGKIPAGFEGGQMPFSGVSQARVHQLQPGRVPGGAGRTPGAAPAGPPDRAWLKSAGLVAAASRSAAGRRRKPRWR